MSWLVCAREVCIYDELTASGVTPSRCIKHGLVLAPRPYLRHTLTREEARRLVDRQRAEWRQ